MSQKTQKIEKTTDKPKKMSKKKKFMAIFFPIFGAAAIATGVTLGCLYGCHEKKPDDPIIPDWKDVFDDPGEQVRHQKATDVKVAVQYEFNLKEAVPTGEKVYGDVEVVKYSHNGVHATVTDFELNEGQKKATFTAAIDSVPSNANGTTTYWADIKAEVKCKKTIGDEVVWETTIEDMRVEVEVGDTPTPPGPAPTDYNYMTITTDKDTTVNFKLVNKGVSVQDRKPNVDYWDGDSFETINWGTAETISGEQVFSYEIDLAAGQTLYLKGDNPTGFNYLSEDWETKSTVSIVSPEDNDDSKWTLGGSPMALVNDGSKQEEDSLTVVGDGCFAYLFINEIDDNTYYKNTNISSIANPDTFLPATTLTTYCYGAMFNSCDSLTNIPDIPATDIAIGACAAMFQECNSLISIDDDWGDSVETVEMAGFQGMFLDCVNLQTPMSELPATSLGDLCYEQMFIGCESLQYCPELPAENLAPECYGSMFQDCYALTEAPELPATELPEACYEQMFCNCYSITTIPNITIVSADDEACSKMFEFQSTSDIPPVESWITLEVAASQGEANFDISGVTALGEDAFTDMFGNWGKSWRGGVVTPTTSPGFYKFVVATSK